MVNNEVKKMNGDRSFEWLSYVTKLMSNKALNYIIYSNSSNIFKRSMIMDALIIEFIKSCLDLTLDVIISNSYNRKATLKVTKMVTARSQGSHAPSKCLEPTGLKREMGKKKEARI